MKHGKNPTVSQRKLLRRWGLVWGNWLVVKDTPRAMTIVHRHSGEVREILKE